MLTEERFLKILGYLMAYYNTFKFDLKDERGQPSLQFKVWYDVFKDFEEDMIVMAVQSYCRSNVYAPQSPTSILEHVKKRMIGKQMSGEEAWEKVHDLMLHGSYDYPKTIKQRYADTEPVLYATYERLKPRLYGLLTADVPYVRREFIEIYENLMKEHVNGLVNKDNDKFLEIGNGDSKRLIEKKGE